MQGMKLMCNGRWEVQGGAFMPPRLPARQRAKGQTGGGIGHCQPPALPGHRGRRFGCQWAAHDQSKLKFWPSGGRSRSPVRHTGSRQLDTSSTARLRAGARRHGERQPAGSLGGGSAVCRCVAPGLFQHGLTPQPLSHSFRASREPTSAPSLRPRAAPRPSRQVRCLMWAVLQRK